MNGIRSGVEVGPSPISGPQYIDGFSQFPPQFTSHNTWSDFDLVPDLIPDSSPASLSSPTLLTPETGTLLTGVDTTPHFERPMFGDGSTDHVLSYLGELEDSLSRDSVASYSTMLEDIACHPSLLLIQPSSAVAPTSTPIPRSISRNNSHISILGPPRRDRSSISETVDCSNDDRRLSVAGTPSPTRHPPSQDLLVENSDKEEQWPLTASPRTGKSRALFPCFDPQSCLGKRCRMSPPGDGAPVAIEGPSSRRSKVTVDDDDDADYIPPTRQARSKGTRSPSTLSGSQPPSVRPKTGPKAKRRASKKSRSFMSSSSTPRSRCQHCKTTFSRAGDVDRHQKSLACSVLRRQAEANGTLDEAKFPCPICGDRLSRNDSQARHFDNTHPDVDPSVYGLKLRKGRP